MKHTLQIKSLRDTMASCSCNKWSYTATPLSQESDDAIRRKVKSFHWQHVHQAKAEDQELRNTQPK